MEAGRILKKSDRGQLRPSCWKEKKKGQRAGSPVAVAPFCMSCEAVGPVAAVCRF